MQEYPQIGRRFFSTVAQNGTLELSISNVDLRELKENEVLIQMKAAPINPSDLGLLFSFADTENFQKSNDDKLSVVSSKIPTDKLPLLEGRKGVPTAAGNEGAGTVVHAGKKVMHMQGKNVTVFGGPTYSQYLIVPASNCVVLTDGIAPSEAASFFVNPLTALAMVETMRLEGHSAIVHTAAASNLGQMLNKICVQDEIDLVNIVRSQAQTDILSEVGATYIVNSSSENFQSELVKVISETDATIAFDAVAGGELANSILKAMETVALVDAEDYKIYGSTTHKQIYLYGGLNKSPTILDRSYGMSWNIGGWLLFRFLRKIGPEEIAKLNARILKDIRTTFASHYTATISLDDLIDPEIIKAMSKKSTGQKFLLNPSL